MSIFNSRKSDSKNDKRTSLEAFKAKADNVTLTDSIDKITGGALSGCHPGGLALSALAIRSVANIATF